MSTTLNAWMGLTVRCAECHSHKYDPISQIEYYQLLDFFNQSQDADTRDEKPRLAVPAMMDASVRDDFNQRIADAEKQLADSRAARKANDAASEEEKKRMQQQTDAHAKTVKDLIAKRDLKISVPVMEDLAADKRRKTHVMLRGNFQSLGDHVSAAFPLAFELKNESNPFPMNRLGMAQWMFDDRNPLTARVAVNRFWARVMGIGLVETEEDFGTQGSPPSHPKLLDYLAAHLRQHDWDERWLLRQIVTSQTYRQSPLSTKSKQSVDPRNRLYARGPRIRMAAEVVRDQALAVSGLLSTKMHGPPVYPPSPIKKIVNAFTGGFHWRESQGEDRYRRAIYTYIKRSSPHPLFVTFDMSNRDVCSMRRLRTNTPLQSFMTLNDVTFIEAARALAEQMIDVADGHPWPDRQSAMDGAFQFGMSRALYRPATQDERTVLGDLFERSRTKYQDDIPAAMQFLGMPSDDQTLQKQNEQQRKRIADHAAMTVVCNVILNLDGFLNN
ncbi:MAG: DUF1553 domain-containing protein [Planctomycetota bacterium]